MSHNTERQEAPTTDNVDQTTEQVNQNHIDNLATELEEFLKPGGSMLITDLQKEDSDFLRCGLHLIDLRSIQLTSSLVKLQLQELQVKKQYLLEAKTTYSSKSTAQSISPPLTDSAKLKENMKTLKSASESRLSTTQSKNVSADMPSQTKKS
jgi:hypothetical protein